MQYGFVIDQTKCIGCHACTVACKAENQVPVGVFRTWVKYVEKGTFPNVQRDFAVLRCNHCSDAPCVEICPTRALYKRKDGIVDFDGNRCIGCKSCMQACPYDALYIDPDSNTAAKCNYCAHRVEVGLEPACVVVCPEQAIIPGDVHDPSSQIYQIVTRDAVHTRRPEQGTGPNVYYKGADQAILAPELPDRGPSYLWSQVRQPDQPRITAALPGQQPLVDYDIHHPAPWGRTLSGYLFTKSVAGGAPLAALILLLLGVGANSMLIQRIAPVLSLVFLALTVLLLVADLKRPERVWRMIFLPNPRSWLVWGTYLLMLLGVLDLLWLITGPATAANPLIWLTALVGIAAAGYTGFLFGQAEGRDFWQSPHFTLHLVAKAGLAGLAGLILIGLIAATNVPAGRGVAGVLAALVVLNIVFIVLELTVKHGTLNAKLAADYLLTKLGVWFWIGVVVVGTILPLVLLSLGGRIGLSLATGFAAALALIGLAVYDDLFIQAGQAPPMS